MSVFLLHSKTAWNDYFTGTNPPNLNSQTFTSRPTLSDTSVYISNCLFRSISSTSGNGGALFCNSATYFLVEPSSFFSCKTSSGYGGAIYFENINNGQSVLYEVCGYDCYTTYTNPNYQFAFLRVYNTALSKNYVNYSSITRSVNMNSDSYNNMGLIYGKILCPSVNFSLNKCYGNQFYCQPYADSSYTTCSFTYSSFTDNTAIRCTCIVFNTGNAKYEIKSCNILRNHQNELDSQGTIYAYGNLMIEDSCILANTATYIFFQSSSSYTTLSNCTVDSTSSNRNLNIQNTVTKSFILALKHMSNLICHSEYDSIGTLTPIIQTPSSSKKQIHCYTYVKCLNQSLLIDFFSLTCILIFNFIHSYPSIYHY
jgi:hypothetical protein